MRKALGTGSGVGAGRGANSSSLYNTNSDASSSEYSQGSVTQAQYLRPVSAHATSSVYSRRSSDGAVRYGGALLAGGGGGTKGISPRGSFNALAGSTSQNMVVEEEEDEEGDNDD